MAVVLDVTHPSQGAETIAAATAAAFYALADLGTGDAIEFTITPVQASTAYVGGNYWALFADASATGGIWLVDTTLRVFTSGGDVQGLSQAMTWSAGQTLRFRFWNNAGTRSVTISQATTGNGTFALSQVGPFFSAAQNLGVGSVPGLGAYRFNGAISDVTDGQTTVSRSGSITATSTVSATGRQTHARGGSITATSTVTANNIGAVSRSGSITATSAVSAAGRQTHVRSGSITATTTVAAAGTSGSFARGAYGSARVLFGSAAGTVSVTLNTAASGSTVLACVGGRLADLATAMTDSRGNTWTLLHTEEYARWAGYGIRVYRCIGLNGGTGHVFSQQYGQTAGFDECTIAVYEQRGAAHIEATSMVERGIAASLLTGVVSSQAACAWVVFFSGDAPTGSTAALTPSNGLTILDQSTGIDHPNGYVPIVILAADKPPGSHQSTIGIVPSQGAIIFAATVQQFAVIGRSGSITATSAVSAAGRQTHVRSGSITATSTVAAAGRQAHTRSGSVTATSAVGATGRQAHVRSGSITALSTVAASGPQTVRRSGSITATSTVTATGRQTHVRSGSITATSSVEASLSAASVPRIMPPFSLSLVGVAPIRMEIV